MRKSTGATGTISYCAPEVLRQDASGRFGNFTAKSDIFSLGMILYFLCFGRLPYSSAENIQEEFEDLDQLRAEISTWSGFRDERQERPDLPDQLYEFLRRLLAIDPTERPSANEILHAIRTESGLDSPPRVGRSTSGNGTLGIGKRIQAVDSPAPRAPVNGNGRVLSSIPLEDARSDSDSASMHEASPIHTPEREIIESLAERRDRSRSPQTPLLMPPPSTRLSSVKTRLTIYRHNIGTWVMLNHRTLSIAARLVIFVVKMYALTKPCLPLATKPLVAYPLLLLAALDLGLGTVTDWRLTAFLTAAHFAVVMISMRHNNLCAGGRELWEWEVDVHHVAV